MSRTAEERNEARRDLAKWTGKPRSYINYTQESKAAAIEAADLADDAAIGVAFTLAKMNMGKVGDEGQRARAAILAAKAQQLAEELAAFAAEMGA